MRPRTKVDIKKLSWNECKATFKKVAKDLYDCIEEINPDESFYLYQADYRYGDEIVGEGGCLQLPCKDGSLIRLDDLNLPKHLQKDLNYNFNTMVLSLIVKGQIDIYSPSPHSKLQIEGSYNQGVMLATRSLLSNNIHYTGQPLFRLSSGSRSAFSIASLGNSKNFDKIRKTYNITTPLPNGYSDHFYLFKQLAKKSELNWRSTLLLFPVKWFEAIKQKKNYKWALLYLALLERSWNLMSYEKNTIYSERFWLNFIENTRNKTIDKYIKFITKHIIATSLGGADLYKICYKDREGPFSEITKIIIEDYGLDDQLPIIATQTNILRSDQALPGYIALKQLSKPPEFPVYFKKRSLLKTSLIVQEIFFGFVEYLRSRDKIIEHNPLLELFKLSYDFYYFQQPANSPLKDSSTIFNNDPAVEKLKQIYPNRIITPSSKNTFLVSCVKITRNKS
jgi:hypothetical protein